MKAAPNAAPVVVVAVELILTIMIAAAETTWQTSDWIITCGLGSIVLAIIIAGIRYRPPTWRWLLIAECFFLFWCFGNCFLPGSWKEFWQFEIPLAAISISLALSSAILRRRIEPRISLFGSTQMASVYAVMAIILIMIVCR